MHTECTNPTSNFNSLTFDLENLLDAFYLIDDISRQFGVSLADYPELKKLVDMVGSQPNVKKWIETRPKMFR